MNISAGLLATITGLVFALSPIVTLANHDQNRHSFVDAGVVSWNQLVTCSDSPAVYLITADGKRHAFPDLKTYSTWYPDFTFVMNITCEGLSEFPVGKNVTYHPGTRYVKIPSAPTVYAVEPGGVLRAIPNEEWMEVFVGDGWNEMIDDVPEAFWPTYEIGEPLDIREIPDGMTAFVNETQNHVYFVDGQPKSLRGVSYNYYHNDHFKSFTRLLDQAPSFYERIQGEIYEAPRIEGEDEIFVGLLKTNTDDWIDRDDFPFVRLLGSDTYRPILDTTNRYTMNTHGVSFSFPEQFHAHEFTDGVVTLSTRADLQPTDTFEIDRVQYLEQTTLQERIDEILATSTTDYLTPQVMVERNGNAFTSSALFVVGHDQYYGNTNIFYHWIEAGEDLVEIRSRYFIMEELLASLEI